MISSDSLPVATTTTTTQDHAMMIEDTTMIDSSSIEQQDEQLQQEQQESSGNNCQTQPNFPTTPPAVSTPTSSMIKDDLFDNIGTPNLLLFNTYLSSSDLNMMVNYTNNISTPTTPIHNENNSSNNNNNSMPDNLTIPTSASSNTSSAVSTATTQNPTITLTTSNHSQTLTNNIVYSTPGSSSSTPSLISSPSTNFHYQSPQPSPLPTPLSPPTPNSSTISLSNSTSSISTSSIASPTISTTLSKAKTTPITITSTYKNQPTHKFSQSVQNILPATITTTTTTTGSIPFQQQQQLQQSITAIITKNPHIRLQVSSEEYKFTVFASTLLKIQDLKQKISTEFIGLFGTGNINKNPLSKLNVSSARLRDQYGNDLSYTKTVGDLLSDMDTVIVQLPGESTLFNSIFPNSDALSAVSEQHSASYSYSMTTNNITYINNPSSSSSSSSSNPTPTPSNLNSTVSSPSTVIPNEETLKKIKFDNNSSPMTVSSPIDATVSSPVSSVFSPPQQPLTPISNMVSTDQNTSDSNTINHLKRQRTSFDSPSTNYFSSATTAGGGQQHVL